MLAEAKHNPLSVVAAAEATVSKTPRKQAVAAALIYFEGVCVKRTHMASGMVTAPDAELHAIRVAVGCLTMVLELEQPIGLKSNSEGKN